MVSSEFVRFVISGGVAAAANFGSRFVFSLWLPYEAAVTCAYGVGMVTAFVLMRSFAFRAQAAPWRSQVGAFVLVNLLAVAQTVVISSLLARWALPALGWQWHAEAVAHAVGVAVPVLTSYLGHRHATFGKGRRASEPASAPPRAAVPGDTGAQP